MFLKKRNRIFSKIPVSVRVTFLFSITISSAILLEDKYINKQSTEELVEAVEEIYENPDKFENFDDGIYCIKYNENNDIIAGKIPKDFDMNLPFSIEDINTYQIGTKKFLYYDTRLKDTKDWIRGIYPLSKYQNEGSRIWVITGASLLIILVIIAGYNIIKNAFKPVNRISNTALEIKNSKNFSRRIELDYGEDEIYKMASTFNEMLDTVEEVFIHEKQFSSDVSHELRTPISVILAHSDYALNYTETLKEAMESFEVINRQAEKMRNLINQIMELSKLERQNEIEKERLNFSNIILELLADYKTLLEINEEKKIDLSIDIEKDLRLYGNRLMLERVFINLFTNAMKFTETMISVSLKKINKKIILQVRDNGIGISKKDQKYIWNRFFQTSNSRNKDKNKGSGLGLSMVNRIVQLHSGTIELESELDKGSCFIIKFPV